MLKKILIFWVALIMCLGILSGCGGVELKQGTYITDDGLASVELFGDNEYAFVRNIAISYCPTGKYKIENKKLILYVADEIDCVFNIKDGQLIFVSGAGLGTLFESGTIFKLIEE